MNSLLMISSAGKDKDTNKHQAGVSNASTILQSTENDGDYISSLIDNVMSTVFDDEDDSSLEEKSFSSYNEYAASFLRDIVEEIDDDDDDFDDVSLGIIANDLPSLERSYCSIDIRMDDSDNSITSLTLRNYARDFDIDCAVIDDVLNDERDDTDSIPAQTSKFGQFITWLRKQ